MKRRFLLIGLLASSVAYAQQFNKSYRQRQLKHTEIELLTSFYAQDNNHSAVTGGVGTEKLSVFAQQVSFDFVRDSARSLHFDVGVDVITSASTDNIDFIKSSASRRDGRYHTSLGYSRFLRNKLTSLGGSFTFSLESDYISKGPTFTIGHRAASGNREVTLLLQAFFDDLRWFDRGRLSGLIYPSELRTFKWFDIYKRNSFNASLSFYQTINRRMAIGLYPGIAYQKGLLSTPFHRVFFSNDARKVENLPRERLKVPIGVQLNSFIGPRTILRTYYRYYWDDFEIIAHTFELELPVKISGRLTLTPFVRLYQQKGSPFFAPFEVHDPAAQFYTSDYDLSTFTSYKPGLSVRLAPYGQKGRTTFKDVEFRFAHYRRSDGLAANMVSVFLGYDRISKETGKPTAEFLSDR